MGNPETLNKGNDTAKKAPRKTASLEEQLAREALTSENKQILDATAELQDKSISKSLSRVEYAFGDKIVPQSKNNEIINTDHLDLTILGLNVYFIEKINAVSTQWYNSRLSIAKDERLSVEDRIQKIQELTSIFSQKAEEYALSAELIVNEITSGDTTFSIEMIEELKNKIPNFLDIIKNDRQLKDVLFWSMGFAADKTALGLRKNEHFNTLSNIYKTRPSDQETVWLILDNLPKEEKIEFGNFYIKRFGGGKEFIDQGVRYGVLGTREYTKIASDNAIDLSNDEKEKYASHYENIKACKEAARTTYIASSAEKNKAKNTVVNPATNAAMEAFTMKNGALALGFLASSATLVANVAVNWATWDKWKHAPKSLINTLKNPYVYVGAAGAGATYTMMTDGWDGLKSKLESADIKAIRESKEAKDGIEDLFNRKPGFYSQFESNDTAIFAFSKFTFDTISRSQTETGNPIPENQLTKEKFKKFLETFEKENPDKASEIAEIKSTIDEISDKDVVTLAEGFRSLSIGGPSQEAVKKEYSKKIIS